MDISVGNSYSEDQLMQTALENLQQGGNYYDQIIRHQAELRGEENFIRQKSLSISEFQMDDVSLENLVRNNESGFFSQLRFSYCGGSHLT